MAFKAEYNQTAPEIACAFYGAERGASIFPEQVMDKIEAEKDLDLEQMVAETIEQIWTYEG